MRVQFRPDRQQNITAMDGPFGGWSKEQDVQGHPEIQKICDMVRDLWAFMFLLH